MEKELVQKAHRGFKTSQIVNLAKNKNKNKLLNVNRAVAKVDPRHRTLVCS